MVEDILKNSPRYLAFSQLYPTDDLDYYLKPEFESVGCLTEIIDFQINRDNTYDIITVGLERAELIETMSSDDHLYRSVMVNVLPYPDIQKDVIEFFEYYTGDILEKCEHMGLVTELEGLLEKFRENVISARACLHIMLTFFTQDANLLQELLNDDSGEILLDYLKDCLA